MQIRYVCYLSAAFGSEEDFLHVLTNAAGDMGHRGIHRLDMSIPEEVDISLVHLIFKGLAVDHDKHPNDYVFAIYKESERAVQELYIRLEEARREALDAGVSPAEVAAALVESAEQMIKDKN